MTDAKDASHADPRAPEPTPAPPQTGARRLGRAVSTLLGRSSFNRRQTFAKIAHRRLWRPATYPRTDWKAWLCYAVALVVLFALVLDQPVGSFGRRWPNELVNVAEVATKFALSGWYLYPAALIALIVNLTDWSQARGRRLLRLYNWTMLSIFVLASIGIPGLIGTFLKHFVGRARPFHFAEMGAFSLHPLSGSSSFASMPSGHSCTVGSVAMMLVLLFPASRYIVIPGALALGMTRVVLSSHYPSDVAAGLALGAGFTLLIAYVSARLGYIFRLTPDGRLRRRKSFKVFW